jgi:hypothetical protein
MNLSWKNAPGKIPTTLVPLAPEKILLGENADLLVGVFHIMWADMPRRRTYPICLQDLISNSGDYLGTRLSCGTLEKDLLGKLPV